MNKFIKRVWLTLRAIGQFIGQYLLHPISRFFRPQSGVFNGRHKSKLSAAYWQKQWQHLRAFNWRNLRTGNFKPVLRGAYKLILLVLLFWVGLYLAIYVGLFGRVPSRTALKARQNHTASEVYSTDNILLGRYYIQDRTNVNFENISPTAVKALIATEDARFYDHSGVDYRSLLRVLFKTMLLQEEKSGGGSTISQQLVKNLYPRRQYYFLSTPINKLREMIIARRLENIYSKTEILELYLNTVPMGGDLFGIERAARRFFNTTADSVKTEEAAVLIGMLKATTTYNPRLNLEKSRQRRNVVLNQMAKYGYLPPAQADSLKNLPLKLKYRYETHNDGLAPYFREQLRLELVKWCATQVKADGKPYNLYTDGLKIYTTLHAGMQTHAERAMRKRMARLQSQFDAHWKNRSPWGNNPEIMRAAMRRSKHYQKLKAAGLTDAAIQEQFRQPKEMNLFSWRGTIKRTLTPNDSLRYYERFLNTGLLAVEPETGYVRAWVGGIDHHTFKYDHVRSRRQAGSTFKPIVYTAALERGLEPCTYFPNQLQTYTESDNWTPHNADNKYGGEYSMRGALAHSVNTISAQVLMKTGLEPTISLARRLGIQSPLPKVPSLALGTADLSLLELVTAYATIANNGYRIKPVYIAKITDRNGKILRQHRPGAGVAKAVATEHAATMLELLKGVVQEGSANRLRSEFSLTLDIAGKTGTSQDHADGWFIGITPQLVTGVWVGAENPAVRFRTLSLGQGSNTALPIWGDFMSRVVRDREFANWRNSHFPLLPPELQQRLNCPSFLAEQPAVIKQTSFLDKLFDVFKSKKKERKERKKEEKEKKKGRGRFWD
ncbi:penicillin-binding protein 1A [Adhaeribacter rhizoryzae]|uniref:penicillin-binding protein 1A n=1 Tax=Adhaeribacter rhizoryzae TaxID=2607907 RepID=UPI001CC22024|nr:transglycosylase domain-containing protein [Adhaeribacter rhizoryzae]